MHCEDLFINDSCNWQAVEAVCKGLPQFDIIPSFAFIVESVDAVDRCTLVVSSQDEEVLWILDLVR